jgi:hypothetical protein
MDLLTAAVLACSLHPDEGLVRALVQGQSQGTQYFVGDLTDLKGSAARERAEASARLLTVESKGHRAALGFLGLPADWAEAYGHEKTDLWDACVNISVGTAKLSEFDYECRKTRRPRASRTVANRSCVIRRFAHALDLAPPQVTLFVSGILMNLRDMTHRPPMRGSRPEAPTGALPSSDWSADLFFQSEPKQSPPLPPLSDRPEGPERQ